eukprot:GHUV01029777.1.p1 GENE.GHUV01029777.1~~GHUV01029777.1.p1  ORF type:complete len:143 (+),score=42.63 GHUV01029777.1:237-665(+)
MQVLKVVAVLCACAVLTVATVLASACNHRLQRHHHHLLILIERCPCYYSLLPPAGSATQIGVLVVPFCVVLAWIMGRPLDLNFNEFEGLVLFVSVLLTALMVQDGTSNWLKGALMMVTYIFVAAGFWVHKDALLQLDEPGSR